MKGKALLALIGIALVGIATIVQMIVDLSILYMQKIKIMVHFLGLKNSLILVPIFLMPKI